jgi:hypothetical protein
MSAGLRLIFGCAVAAAILLPIWLLMILAGALNIGLSFIALIFTAAARPFERVQAGCAKAIRAPS